MLREKCTAIMTGGGPTGFGMPGGVAGGVAGGIGGSPFARGMPEMGHPMANFQGGPLGGMYGHPVGQSGTGGHGSLAFGEASREGSFNGDLDGMDGESRGGRFRAIFRRQRSGPHDPSPGGRSRSSGPQMYGAFLVCGRL